MQLLSYEELKETITNKIKTRVIIYYQWLLVFIHNKNKLK